jgi:hypothetical protein
VSTEKGPDLLITDSSHNHGLSDRAIIDTADSLLAIRKVIYEKKSRVLMTQCIYIVMSIP